MQEGNAPDVNNRFDYYVEETPYYRPPVRVFNGQQEVLNTSMPTNNPAPKKGGNFGLYGLAAIIGILTVGSVIYSKE